MVTLRCTQKLLKRLKVAPSSQVHRSTSRLGDWYAAPFAVGHLRLVMCVSERSLLPVFVRARGLALMLPDFQQGVLTLLAQLGFPNSVLQVEQEQLSDLAVARTESRSVLGSMNDFAVHGRAYLETTHRPDLIEMSLELSEIPCSPLKYNRPKDAARELLGAA